MAESTTVEQSDAERRQHPRRPVLWRARLEAGAYSFDCGVFNMSLSGARLRLALPLKRGAEVTVLISQFWLIPARVVWHKDDQVGIKFEISPEQIRTLLGEERVERLQLAQ